MILTSSLQFMKTKASILGLVSIVSVSVAAPPLTNSTRQRFEEMALNGNLDAQLVCGHAFERGIGGDLDKNLAIFWYLSAAKAGDLVAIDGLARLLSRWSYSKELTQESLNLVLNAAERGDAKSRFNLACFFANGVLVSRNTSEAEKWLKRAAAAGDEDAVLFLNYLFSEPHKSTPADMALQAGISGLSLSRESAHFLRGYIAETGWGRAQEREIALKSYRIAADLEQPQAQYRLGVMKLDESGHPEDLVEAYVWIYRASVNGADKEAGDELLRLRKRMTAGQLDEASVQCLQWDNRRLRGLQL